MKIILIIFIVLFLTAASPLYIRYENAEYVAAEFQNVYSVLQGKQLDVYYSTPSIANLTERQINLIKTDKYKLAIRVGNTIQYFNSN